LETLKLQVESKIKQLEDKLTNMNNSVLANKIFGKDVPRIEKEILELKKVKENIKQLELKENIRNGL
jgi:hypothetical protein